MIKVSVSKKIDSSKLTKSIEGNSNMLTYSEKTFAELVDPYVPYRTGRLSKDVSIHNGSITYNAPYASKVYQNNMNFRKDKHPLATSHWDKVALPQVRQQWEKSVQDYLNRNGVDNE